MEIHKLLRYNMERSKHLKKKSGVGETGGGKLPRKLVQHITGSQQEITKNWTIHTVSKCKKLTLLLKQIENWYLIQSKSE